MKTDLIIFSGKAKVDSGLLIVNFLNYLGGNIGKIIQNPIIFKREAGLTGFCATDNANIVLFANNSELSLEMHMFSTIDIAEVKEMLEKNFNMEIDSIVRDSDFKKMITECEEPGCTREATRIWQGRKVCEDHYEEYKEQRARIYLDDEFLY